MVKNPATKKPLRSLSEGELRQMLLAKQQELLTSIRHERIGLREGSVQLAVDSLGDQADRPGLTPEAEIGYKVMDHRASLLVQIDLALTKLDERTYGRCEMCEEPIPLPRLQVLPFAIGCTRCQEAWEHKHRRTSGQSVFPGELTEE